MLTHLRNYLLFLVGTCFCIPAPAKSPENSEVGDQNLHQDLDLIDLSETSENNPSQVSLIDSPNRNSNQLTEDLQIFLDSAASLDDDNDHHQQITRHKRSLLDNYFSDPFSYLNWSPKSMDGLDQYYTYKNIPLSLYNSLRPPMSKRGTVPAQYRLYPAVNRYRNAPVNCKMWAWKTPIACRYFWGIL